jgi:uncharacterized protein (DUF342 family)
MEPSHNNGDISSELAEIAIANRIITKTDLKKALYDIHVEKGKGKDLSLVDYFLERDIVDKETMRKLIAATIRSIDKKFAVLAVRFKLAPQDVVVKALEIQKYEFKKGVLKSIGDILIETKVLTEDQRRLLLDKLNGPSCDDLLRNEGGGRDVPEDGHDASAELEKTGSFNAKDLIKCMTVDVSKDAMRATIHVPGGLEEKPKLEDIKDIVKAYGLTFGVIDDDAVESHLSKIGDGPYSFVIAIGIHELQPRDATVRIFFINDYLNPGKITEDGTIDFKDRGAVPFVDSGIVLAEKIPGVDGKSGMDVYGNPVQAEVAKDAPFKNGLGTVLSDNGLKIISTMKGQPLMTIHGEVMVMKELHIPGDVDYTTGNIIFEGSVIVKGSINPGFTVTCGNLTALYANGAEIDVVGNIEISGGVMDSVLRAGGAVHAMHMSGTKVDAYGDVLIKKEVIDCKIRTSGAFSGEGVQVVSSYISAKKGILAKKIGTDVSKPCVLRVGISDHTDRKIRRYREQLEVKKSALEQEQKKKESSEVAQKNSHIKIMEQVQAEEKLNQQKNIIEEKMSFLSSVPDHVDPAGKQKKLLIQGVEFCDSEKKKIEERIEELFRQQDMLTHQILDLQSQCESLVHEIERLNQEILEIKAWDKKIIPFPQVKVIREIVPQTSVNGPNSLLVIKDTLKNVTIKEVHHSFDNIEWEMKIESN